MMKIRRNHIDLATLTAVLILMVLSLGVVYSASSTWAYEKFGESSRLLNSHAIKILLGIAAMFIGINIDYIKFKKFTKAALVIAIVFLVATIVLGGETKGATRWLRFGSIGFQPSEFAKFALLFHLCALISTKGELVRDLRKGYLPMMIWIGSVAGLVILQPNFSAGTMIILLSCVMLFVSRAKFIHLLVTGVTALPILGLYMVSAPYRMDRIQSFISGHSNGKSGRGSSASATVAYSELAPVKASNAIFFSLNRTVILYSRSSAKNTVSLVPCSSLRCSCLLCCGASRSPGTQRMNFQDCSRLASRVRLRCMRSSTPA
jgi:cell division protein FtsW (lipid II flippase)